MKKIKINLNPKKPATFEQGFGKILNYTPLLILLVTFFALVVIGVGVFSLAKAKEYNNYQSRWEEWEPKNKQLIEVKQELSGLEKTSEKIKEVLAPENTGIVLLESIFSSLPKNIWFKKLHFEKSLVNIQGYVVEWEKNPLASLENFINQLQKDKNFSKRFTKISIKDTKNINFNGVETTQFTIKCSQ